MVELDLKILNSWRYVYGCARRYLNFCLFHRYYVEAAAENAASLTIGAILHPARAARMIEYHSRRNDVPGLAEVLDKMISFTWKSGPKPGLQAEIQRVVNNVLLHELMRLAADEEAATGVCAIAFLKIEELKGWLRQEMQSVEDEIQKAHFFQAIRQIKLFQDNPDRIKRTAPLPLPQGPPIGMED